MAVDNKFVNKLINAIERAGSGGKRLGAQMGGGKGGVDAPQAKMPKREKPQKSPKREKMRSLKKKIVSTQTTRAIKKKPSKQKKKITGTQTTRGMKTVKGIKLGDKKQKYYVKKKKESLKRHKNSRNKY